MKKTIYFKKMCNQSNSVQIIDELLVEKEKFLENSKNEIAKIDSEDLRVDSVHTNQSICILRLTYFEK
jgi:hypothetical protein